MKTINQSREEFNSTMNPYTLMVVQTEHTHFSDEGFRNKGLICPSERVAYTPPLWTGVSYGLEAVTLYLRGEKPLRMREEKIPVINSLGKYLICDDYSSSGQTFEIAMVRLVEAGVWMNNIWCITSHGNEEQSSPILDKGIEWHKYMNAHENILKSILKRDGFKFPSLNVSS